MAKIGFALNAEFFDLVALKEAHDDVDSFRSPTRDLVVEPIIRARARHDRQAAASGQANPINFGAHSALKPRPRYESRVWKSMVDDDKRTVQEIECQPIGGLKFFRQSNCDLKVRTLGPGIGVGAIDPKKLTDELIVPMGGLSPVILFVKVPEMYQSMTGTKLAWGMVRSAAFMKRRI